MTDLASASVANAFTFSPVFPYHLYALATLAFLYLLHASQVCSHFDWMLAASLSRMLFPSHFLVVGSQIFRHHLNASSQKAFPQPSKLK